MKYSKRYIAFTVVLALILILKFNTAKETRVDIGQFRGGDLSDAKWSELVAEDVNSNLLTAIIDNKQYTNSDIKIYMDEDRNIMVPVSILRDALNCGAHVYNESELVVEKHNLEARLEPVEIDGKYYVSLEDLTRELEYSYDFDIASKTIVTADKATGSSVIPERYDLREKQRVSAVKNQGSYGTCWGFAAIGAMESALLPEEKWDFSVDHMTMSNSFNSNQYDGGEYTMGMAYLAAWQGPVNEADDPYGDGVSNPDAKPMKHVQEMQVIEGKNYETIKTAVLKYGGVQSSLYSTLTNKDAVSNFYNARTYSYCYTGTEKPNHDVLIIGWDDNYSKENFPMELESDGAFICQNSWGSDFGENGVFYVSYYDTNIGTHNVVYTRMDDTENYDQIYQSDLCGWVGQMGYNQESIYAANVFAAQTEEVLRAAGFYATGAQTEYKVYVVNNFVSTDSMTKRREVASGTFAQAGYYTVDFTKEVEVAAGERFAILIYLYTPGSTHPLAIEYDPGDFIHSTVNVDDGEGYISYNGDKFIDVKTRRQCNLCIKAFSDRK